MTKRNTENILNIYSTLKMIYGNSNYDHTYRYLTDDLLGNWEKEYYGPVASFLVGGLKNLSCLKDVEEIMIKDGALGVLRFFRTFPTPPSWLKTKFYIKPSLASLAPVEWKENLVVFEDSFRYGQEERDELVIHGVLAKGICCFDNFSNNLRKCLSEKSIKKIHVIIRTPVKMEGYFDEDETYGFNEFLNILMGEVTNDIKVVFYKLDDLEKIDFSRSFYLAIDSSDILYSGLSSEVTMFTRGAIPVFTNVSEGHSIAYNENYGIKVLDNSAVGAKRSALEKIQSEFASATNSYTDLDIANLLLT